MERLAWETAEEMNPALAERSGVSYGSIKRFETTGKISLTKTSMALGCSGEICNLFTDVPYENIQEVINENRQK